MLESNRFQVGDVVMLRSGGPKMTVAEAMFGQCCCVWFDKTRQRTDHFDPAMLFLPRKPNSQNFNEPPRKP